jgi:hypothetical protein
MPECKHNDRVISICGKCSDMFNAQINGAEHDGYVPGDLNIGNGDYIEFSYCLDCGKIIGNFPMDNPEFYDDYLAGNNGNADINNYNEDQYDR